MKQVTIKVARDPIVELTGWLFDYAGLQLVAVQEIKSFWWAIYEYSTGRQANRKAEKTRKATIDIMKQEFDNRGSMQICQAIQTCIDEGPLLN